MRQFEQDADDQLEFLDSKPIKSAPVARQKIHYSDRAHSKGLIPRPSPTSLHLHLPLRPAGHKSTPPNLHINARDGATQCQRTAPTITYFMIT